MALTQEQKDRALEMTEAGADPKQIAMELGVKPIGIYGLVRQDRVRRGLEEPPAKGKKRVKIAQEQEFEAAEDATIGVVPRGSAAAPAAPSANCPLFPEVNEQEVRRVKVTRVLARPASAGEGTWLIDAEADESVIAAAYGGGRYELVALNPRGVELVRRVVEIPGKSKPRDKEETDDEIEEIAAPPPAAVATPGVDMIAMQIQLMREQAKLEREAFRQRIEEERMAQRERAQESAAIFQAQMNMQAANFQQVLQIVSHKKESSPNPMMDKLMMVAIERLIDGPDRTDDTMLRLLDKGPEILSSITEYAKATKSAAPVPTPQAMTAPPAATPAPGVDPYAQIGNAIYRQLIADGVDQATATRLARTGYGYATAVVKQARGAQRNGHAKAPPAEATAAEEKPEEAPHESA